MPRCRRDVYADVAHTICTPRSLYALWYAQRKRRDSAPLLRGLLPIGGGQVDERQPLDGR